MKKLTKTILLPQSVAQGRWGYLRPDGSWAIPPQFEFARPFAEGVASVRRDGSMGYIRPDGSEALPLRYQSAGEFEKGRSEVKTDTGMGVIREDGSFVIEPRFEFSWRDEWKGRDIFRTDGNDGRHALFDFDGNMLLSPQDDDIFATDFGLLVVEREGRWGIATEDGQFIVPPEYRSIDGFDEYGWARANRGEDGPTVFFDRAGEVAFAPDVDCAESFYGGLAAARRDGKWGTIDREGRTVLPFRFDGVGTYCDGLFSVFEAHASACSDDSDFQDGDWFFVDRRGEPVFSDRFDAVANFEDGIAWCEAKGGRWGPFLREGRFLVPPVYDYIGWEVGPFMSGWKDDYELMNWFDRMGRIIECGRNGGRNAPCGGWGMLPMSKCCQYPIPITNGEERWLNLRICSEKKLGEKNWKLATMELATLPHW